MLVLTTSKAYMEHQFTHTGKVCLCDVIVKSSKQNTLLIKDAVCVMNGNVSAHSKNGLTNITKMNMTLKRILSQRVTKSIPLKHAVLYQEPSISLLQQTAEDKVYTLLVFIVVNGVIV